MKPEEFDIVRLVRSLPENGLSVGAEGTVVMDYTQYPPEDAPASYEVEFTNAVHETLAVVAVREEDLQVVNRDGKLGPHSETKQSASVASTHGATMTSESEAFLRIKLTADDGAPFTVKFEPSGMTYDLDGGGFMFAYVVDPFSNEFELENWQGGVSIWAPGAVITRDADGRELHRLN